MSIPRSRFILTTMAFVLLAFFALPAGAKDAEKIVYAVEMNGTRCGYAELEVSPIEQDGRELTKLTHHLFVMISALGSTFNSNVHLTYIIDPATGQFTYHDSDLKQGDVELSNEVYIENGTARFVYPHNGEEETVEIGGDVLLENTLLFPHLVRDFVEGGAEEKTYQALDVREAGIQNWTYSHLTDEKIELAGKKYDAIVKAKPSGAKGQYVKSAFITTTMGPGIKLDLRPTLALAAA